MDHDVFISHSVKTEDQEVANIIYDYLQAMDIKCFMDKRDLIAGTPFPKILAKAIRQSRVVVLVFSSASDISQAVLNEMVIANKHKIPVIPFRIEDTPPVELEFYLSAPQWLDAFTPPLETHLRTLAEAVKHHLGIETEPGPVLRGAPQSTTEPRWKLKEQPPRRQGIKKGTSVMIRCPKTGQMVSTGIQTDRKSFEAAKLENNTVGNCPACGGNHTWSKSDAVLQE